jgi:Flp pilus assembly protein TadD
MRRLALALVLAFASSRLSSARAQEGRERSPLEPAAWGVVYDVPGTAAVRVRREIVYLDGAERDLALDLYLPPELEAGATRPAVVFLNAIGDRLPDRVKEWGIYSSWPRLVAAHGLAGISMDCDGEHVQESLAALFAFLEREGASLGVDASRLGTYAASANVGEATRYLMGAGCAAGIRCAALYYGWPEVERPRRDLPVLAITAEGDLARSREMLATLWGRILETGAPWTLEIATDLPHAFDAFADRDESRRVIQRTLAFWKSHLEPVPEPPWRPDPARAALAALYSNDARAIQASLGAWIAAHPDDPQGYALRGVALSRLQRGAEARGDLERAIELGTDDPAVRGSLGMVLAFQGQHERAVELLRAGIDGGWEFGEAQGTLGHSLLLLGRNEEAVRAYERAIELGIPPGPRTLGIANYNLGCGYARVGRIDDAFTVLARAVEQGFGPRSVYEGDEDLAGLRADRRFAALMDEVESRAGG